MIHVIYPGSQVKAGIIVTSAIRRSCGYSLVTKKSFSYLSQWIKSPEKACLIIIEPPNDWSNTIIKILNSGLAKVILLGKIPIVLAEHLKVELSELSTEIVDGAKSEPAPIYGFSESSAYVSYRSSFTGIKSSVPRRALERFDFTDEWNNLGFGAIRVDGSIWSLSQCVKVPVKTKLADIFINNNEVTGYAALWDFPSSSLLWFNRAVGPIDSQEWRVVENFIANYRDSDLVCYPVINEIPYGYDAAVTMRLDCDEDVESARKLWTSYENMKIPFSLALHSAVLPDTRHHKLPKEILESGGAILSHTATHAPDWGGSYDAAYIEGLSSANSILEVTGQSVRYAVSPFHQTPDYARSALADAGYEGCIGGIIRNDPDFLMARAGIPPGSNKGFIGHSQQCMLHGDCMLEGQDPLKIFKQAFDESMSGRAFFGYLDHPFSERYQYGWLSEEQRIKMHEEFISYMKEDKNVLFCNENEAMDFLECKTSVIVKEDKEGFCIKSSSAREAKYPVAIEYKGRLHQLSDGVLVL